MAVQGAIGPTALLHLPQWQDSAGKALGCADLFVGLVSKADQLCSVRAFPFMTPTELRSNSLRLPLA